VGGNGEKRTLPLVARYADQWNALFITAERFKELNGRLDKLLLNEGRQPDQVRRTLMTNCILGRDQDDLARKVETRTKGKYNVQELRQHGMLVGTADDFLEQLIALEQAGVQRVMLQWLDLDDMAGLEALARDVLHKMR
jgi:alkanesulfonate monooxygenase SsuD/methylene tetrahydromethanopterin reductase-like flavin-dependent oxidoreductase (luciferase family)